MAQYITFQPSDYFNTVAWTGTSSSPLNVTGYGFNPDMIWNKYRAGAGDHQLYDAVRGATKMLIPNSTAVESTNANGVTAFITDGFTAGSDINVNGGNSVAWGWRAGNSSGSSNSDGSLTSTVSVNTTAGFSIVTYSGTGASSGTETVGHGLGAVPRVVMQKRASGSAQNWHVYHASMGNGGVVMLNDTQALNSQTDYWGNTTPTSSVVTIGPNNLSSGTNVMYCFAEKKGFSRFGSYTGNGNVDGAFVYTGFKPAVLIVKTYTTNGGWQIYDSKRNTSNPTSKFLVPSSNAAETSGSNDIDFLSNGFKTRTTANPGTTDTFMYMAFAEEPLVSSNDIPATAR